MSLQFDFAGRTVLVTGAGQGIGRAIANMFHDAGATLAVLDRDLDALESAWISSNRVTRYGIDVSDGDAVTEVVTAVHAWAGTVDVLVNNAGIVRDRVVWKLSDADWNDVLAVHLNGTFNVTRAVVPLMRQQNYGRVVNVTSYTGLHGAVGQSNYAAAKGGIVGFTKAVAKETARFGVTVNAISPNALTPMVAALDEDRIAEIAEAVPVGRLGAPEEIAAAVGFLASEEAAYVTGVVLAVDGGLAM